MNQLPDDQTMLELLKLANDAEEKLKALCDSTAELDNKWRIRLEPRKAVFKQQDKSSNASKILD